MRSIGMPAAVAFSAKDLLAIGNSDGSVTLVDVKNPRQLRELPPLAGHRNGVAGSRSVPRALPSLRPVRIAPLSCGTFQIRLTPNCG
jgi:hypothetical protein